MLLFSGLLLGHWSLQCFTKDLVDYTISFFWRLAIYHWGSDINLLGRSIFLPHWILFVSVANLQYQMLKILAILASINASPMCIYKPQTFPIHYLIHRIWPKRPRRPWWVWGLPGTLVDTGKVWSQESFQKGKSREQTKENRGLVWCALVCREGHWRNAE